MSYHKNPSNSEITSLSNKLSKQQSGKEARDKDSVTNEAKKTPLINLNLKDELFPAEQLQSSDAVTFETVDISLPSKEAITFLNSLEADHLDPLVFSERLVTTSENGDLGEFVISIENSIFQQQECYLIIAKSLGYVEGVLCGTSFTAYVNLQLQTIEQRHHEFVKVSPIPLDRKTLFVLKNDRYIYTKILTNGNEISRFRKAWLINDVPALILEGANILLVRALIYRKHIPASFVVASIDSDGNLCNSDYSDLGASVKEICNEFVPVIGLQRSIYSKDNSISWRYFLTAEGFLLVRQQVGSPVIMKVAQIPLKYSDKGDKKDDISETRFKKRPLEWEKDMELKSKFTDKKGTYMNNFSVYLGHKPEVRSLLADFLQFLLLRKPDDVLSFAARYFSSFSSRLPPAQPFLNSCTNAQVPDAKVASHQ